MLWLCMCAFFIFVLLDKQSNRAVLFKRFWIQRLMEHKALTSVISFPGDLCCIMREFTKIVGVNFLLWCMKVQCNLRERCSKEDSCDTNCYLFHSHRNCGTNNTHEREMSVQERHINSVRWNIILSTKSKLTSFNDRYLIFLYFSQHIQGWQIVFLVLTA